MFARAHRLRVLLPLVGLVATAATARAQITTYSSPTNISSIAAGSTAVLVDGASLTSGILTNSGTLQFNLSNNLTVTTLLNGAGSFVKTNTGTVTFDNQNGYSGRTFINEGTLFLGPNAGELGLGNTQGITFAGGTLSVSTNVGTVSTPITLAGNGGISNRQSEGSLMVSGAISGAGNLTLLSTGSAWVQPTSVNIVNALTLSPNSLSTFTGTITLAQGMVAARNGTNSPFGATSNPIVIAGGGLSMPNSPGSITIPNPITLGAGGGQFAATANQNLGTISLDGVISGTGSFHRVGGTVFLRAANTFTGDTYLGATRIGAINLEHVDALAGSTLDMRAEDTLGRLQFTGTLSTGTAFVNIGGIKGVRPLGGFSSDTANVSFGGNNQSTIYSGTLGWTNDGDFGYYNQFRKVGTGTLTLTSDNRAAGGVTLAGGVLAVNSDRALGVGTGSATSSNPNAAVNTQPVVMTGGTLQLTTLFTMPRAITLQTGGGGLDTTLLSGTASPTFPGNITGTAGLRIYANGATTGTAVGATVLTGTNTYVGTTTIFTGMVTATSNFGNASNTVALDGGGLLAEGGTRTNAYALSLGAGHGWLRAAGASDTLNQTATISGAGNLLSSGSGVVNLTVANTNSGDVRIVEGTLNAANVGALQDATLDMNAADSGTIGFTVAGNTTYNIGGLKGSRDIDNTGDTLSVGSNNQSTTYSGNLSGAGGLTKVGSGALTLGGTNSYAGGTTVSAGSLIGTTSSLQGAITNNATVEFAQATAGTYAGTMTGSGSLTKSGAGALTLSGNNAYTGTTTVSAGTLLINGNQTAATGGLAVLSGATLGGSGTLGGGMSLAAGSTLSPGNSPGTITAPSGTWAGGANYNWQLVDATGTAGTDWDLADFSGVLDITATSGAPFNVNLWTLSSTGPDVNGNASNFSSNSQYSWKIATAAGGVTGFAANKFQVNTSGTNGTAGFANSFGNGQFSVANVGNDVNVVFSPAVVFDVASGSQTQTQQGAAANMTAAVSVTKNGSGTVVMNGTNSYAGATAVNAGTMEVTGSLTNSAVTVNSGGTLAGTGTVNQSVTVAGGGTLAPGSATASTGILSLGSLALDSTATTKLAVNGTTPGTDFDQVSILGNGSLLFGGTLDLSASSLDSAVAGTTYQLFNFSATPTGDFASLTPLGGIYSGISWSGPVGGVWTSTAGTGGNYLTFSQGTGTLAVVVPEPATLALAAIGCLGGVAALRRRRR